MKIKADTIARTIVLGVALLNQALAATGRAPLDMDESSIYQTVTLAATLAASATAWWKNNSFTWAALKADMHLEKLKKGF
jgi:SPP1 family holin